MIFGSRIRCKDTFSLFNVSVCDKPITSVQCHKLVGIYLDRNILWYNHINKLYQKLRSKLYLFNSINHFLPPAPCQNTIFNKSIDLILLNDHGPNIP